MTKEKISITLDKEVLEEAEDVVKTGKYATLSHYIEYATRQLNLKEKGKKDESDSS